MRTFTNNVQYYYLIDQLGNRLGDGTWRTFYGACKAADKLQGAIVTHKEVQA